MKQYYVASLCRNGILGGGIVADDDGITYKTGKVTVSPKLRNLEMKYDKVKPVLLRVAFGDRAGFSEDCQVLQFSKGLIVDLRCRCRNVYIRKIRTAGERVPTD